MLTKRINNIYFEGGLSVEVLTIKNLFVVFTTMDMGHFLYTSTVEISSEEMEELFLSQALHIVIRILICHRLFAFLLGFLIGQKCFFFMLTH